MLRDDINNAMKEAMKAGQARRVSTLRLINAAILQRETSGAERLKLSDPEILDVMDKMIKQRHESLEIYEKAGRAELAAQEREEIEIISAYLPKKMSDREAGEAISKMIKEIEAETIKDMGRAMAALKGAIRRPHGFFQGERDGEEAADPLAITFTEDCLEARRVVMTGIGNERAPPSADGKKHDAGLSHSRGAQRRTGRHQSRGSRALL